MARKMVTSFGMSDKLGTRTFGEKQELVFLGREISEQKDYSERTALEIDREISRIIEEAYNTARKILTDNKDKLTALAEKLIAQETLEGEALEQVFGEIGLPRPEPKVRPTRTPAPVKPVAEGEREAKPKRAPGVPRLVPKQTPAPSD
jgi:cell division protease FtsH